jgi:glucosamine-6-phosphate deaminase
MEIIIEKDAITGSHAAARVVARLVREKPNAVLGLATGSTPLTLYRELIRLHQEEGLDFSQVTTFNLDEYIGLPAGHKQSYRRFMNKNLFEQINIKIENTHVPDGLAEDVPAACAAYERAIVDAGGIDLQVLGIGSDGHVGFNEPTSSFASRTRIKTLTRRIAGAAPLHHHGHRHDHGGADVPDARLRRK